MLVLDVLFRDIGFCRNVIVHGNRVDAVLFEGLELAGKGVGEKRSTAGCENGDDVENGFHEMSLRGF